MKTTDLIPLSDKLFIVNSPSQGKFPWAFAFLVLGADTHALIDPGCGMEACGQVMEQYGVDIVINSHCHPDHVSGNCLFAGKELLVPEQRVEETGTVKRLSRRLLGPNPEVRDFWETFVQRDLGLRDYTPTKTFQAGETLHFGGISLQAVHTPGHLDDHYCFWEPEENILLTFDVDLTTFGPFYGNPEADINVFKGSLDKIMDIDPRVVASSHRLPVQENIQEELLAFVDKFARNEQRVARALETPRTLRELCEIKPIYGKYIPGIELIYAFFEKNMIEKHLEAMAAEGRVTIQDGLYALDKE